MVKLYKVGGCVRDGILGIKSKDIDYTFVIDDYKPKNMDEAFAYMYDWLVTNGYTVYLATRDCLTIRAKNTKTNEAADFVLARKEVGYIPGTRKPIVELGTLEDDLKRRDFTFNALAIDENGKLIDLFNGVQDLEDRVLKTPLDPMLTFSDDPLRVLRAIRFAIKYDCQFSLPIFYALKNPELPKLMDVVSIDRIREELGKAMKVNSLRTMRLLTSLPNKLVESWFRDGLWLEPTTKE